MKLEIPKAYEPQKVEDEIYSAWEKSGLFNPDNLEGEPFSIMMPPPNVTGILHLGHALENTLMDTMIRYQRLRGKKALLLPGTDHAAIATQAKVEKKLMDEGMKNPREELGREKLVAKIREFAEESKSTILTQIKKLGTSCDWSRLAYTFDEERNAAVKELFVRMYDDGLVYRGYRVVNWSVKGRSTSSDDEIVHVERKAKLYVFKYSKDFPITIATTRPETKLGDTAVAVHPKDKRYKQYIGQTFTVDVGAAKPLEIKVIADEEVDPEFGTGALGVTPAHAQVDFAMYENQKAKQDPIGIIQVIGQDGKMTAEAGKYAGLGVEEARDKFVTWLKQEGLLEGEEEITQSVGTSDRYGDVIEAIPMTQWWLDMNKEIPARGKTLRDLMREALTTGLGGDKSQKVTITPERFTKLYMDRVDNLRDWCLSRQLWWGHRIPVWYREWKPTGNENVMGFHQRTEEQVFNGKTVTYRQRDHGLQTGDQIALENSQTKEIIGYGTITKIEKVTVKDVPLHNPAHGAQYETREQLIEAFKFHHPEKDTDKDSPIWIYTYTFGVLENGVVKEMYVGTKAPESEGWEQDPDTLDTWFSSGSWTFSTLGWPQDTDDLKTYHPTTWMQMGYEILYLWLMRMVLMSAYALKEIPFKDVYIHGMLRDQHGQKFSKSAGNGIDPIEVIETYGADALRISLLLGVSPGNDSRYYTEKIESGRNFTNKLWNISRFVLTSVGSDVRQDVTSKDNALTGVSPDTKTLADRWILSRFSQVVEEVTKKLDKYEFSQAGELLRDFTWNEFADWYLEIAKIQRKDDTTKTSTDRILLYLLERLLTLWHSFMPFVTEEIWKLFGERRAASGTPEFLMMHSWPKAETKQDKEVETKFELLREIVASIRNLRAEYRVEPAQKIPVYLVSKKDSEFLQEQMEIIRTLARVTPVHIETKLDKPEGAISAIAGKVQIYLPLADILDIDKEKERITKELKNAERYLSSLEKKLENKGFIEKAPEKLVNDMKDKKAEAEEKVTRIKNQLESL